MRYCRSNLGTCDKTMTGAGSISSVAPDSVRLRQTREISMDEPAQDKDVQEKARDELRGKLAAKLEKALHRQNGKMRKLGVALAECDSEEKYRKYGELLKVNLAKFKRGQSKAKVVDYYSEDQQEIEIEIAADKTPLENMEVYFKRARKLRNGRPRIQSEMKSTERKISILEKLSSDVVAADTLEELEELSGVIEKELAPKRPKKAKGKPGRKMGPKRFVSSDGCEIFVGRNQRQNDRLTLTIARGNDLFMHASGSPGSHVIIRTGSKGEAPRRTMMEAANLAAYYSKQRNSSYVEVSWTRVKNVSKPRGAKPGLVYLSRHKVLGIEPDEELVRMLHENATEL